MMRCACAAEAGVPVHSMRAAVQRVCAPHCSVWPVPAMAVGLCQLWQSGMFSQPHAHVLACLASAGVSVCSHEFGRLPAADDAGVRECAWHVGPAKGCLTLAKICPQSVTCLTMIMLSISLHVGVVSMVSERGVWR